MLYVSWLAMAELIPILVPLINPNDPFTTLVEWLIAPHVSVIAGQPVARMETTKAVIDVESPAAGELDCVAEVGAELSPGEVIGFVQVVAEAALDPGPSTVSAQDLSDTDGDKGDEHAGDGDGGIRLTREAQRVAKHFGVDPTMLGLVGLVRTRDFMDAVERGPSRSEVVDGEDDAAASVFFSGAPRCHQCGATTGEPLVLTVQSDGYVRTMCTSCLFRQRE
jgi:pyruvate/2-oxoglutarate dehydrogenase complex dihydrolipoamide acyltransferase (E2) component